LNFETPACKDISFGAVEENWESLEMAVEWLRRDGKTGIRL
jgi:hypothetical protein